MPIYIIGFGAVKKHIFRNTYLTLIATSLFGPGCSSHAIEGEEDSSEVQDTGSSSCPTITVLNNRFTRNGVTGPEVKVQEYDTIDEKSGLKATTYHHVSTEQAETLRATPPNSPERCAIAASSVAQTPPTRGVLHQTAIDPSTRKHTTTGVVDRFNDSMGPEGGGQPPAPPPGGQPPSGATSQSAKSTGAKKP